VGAVVAAMTGRESLIECRPRWAAIAAIVVAAGYGGSALAGISMHTDWSNAPEAYTTTYLGHPLHCLVVGDGAVAGRIGGISCDYVRYWRAR
jgi:hypothetical protein